jgi:hypothetical protein
MAKTTPRALGLGEAKKINLCVYGDNGTGKTTLAATAQHHPKMRDVLFANVEGGLLSIEDMDDLPEGILVVDIERPEDVEQLFWDLANRHKEKNSPYATVNTCVLDSGTEMQRVGLEHTIRAAMKRKGSHDKHESVDDPQQEDYGKNARHLGRYIRYLRGLDVNLIITAYLGHRMPPRPRSAPRGWEPRPVEAYPDFTPALRTQVKGYMDFVWYLYKTDKGHRKLLLEEHDIYYAKTRGNLSRRTGKVILWKDLSDPLLARIYRALVEA